MTKPLTQRGFETKAKQGIFYALARDAALRCSGDADGVWDYLENNWATEFRKLASFPGARGQFEPLVEFWFNSKRARDMRAPNGIVCKRTQYDF